MKPRKNFAKIAFLLHLVKKINHEKRCSELLSIVNCKYYCIDNVGQPDRSQHLHSYLPLPKTQINPIMLSVDCYWVREGVDGQLIRS